MSETAAWALHTLSPELWAEHEERITEEGLVTPDLMYWIESWKPGERAMYLTVEKVMVLSSVGVFADVPDEVLADLAGYLEEIEAATDEQVYEKGVVGRTMYIIAEGSVRVHDEEHTFAELGVGEVFGELTTLDPEPHSASVTALEDTRLLGLDRDALYELMSTHPTVLRGLIHVLCGRLRSKGRRR
ncbi:MAG: cyclic nucleotide-binding domain-containing protein [Gemmatimonadetes bacterium]|nr:cyclic nucleotide-binding domain-containing protein [Gemmatimonadota bacterium]